MLNCTDGCWLAWLVFWLSPFYFLLIKDLLLHNLPHSRSFRLRLRLFLRSRCFKTCPFFLVPSDQFIVGQYRWTCNSNMSIFNLNFGTSKWSHLLLNPFIIVLLILLSQFRCIVVTLKLLYRRSFKWVLLCFSDIVADDHILSSFATVGFITLGCCQALSFLNVNGFVECLSFLLVVCLCDYCSSALVVFVMERSILVHFSDVLLGFRTVSRSEFNFPVSIVRSLRL